MAPVNDMTVARAGAGDKDDWLRLWALWQQHMSGHVPPEVTERTWRLAQEPGSRLAILIARAASGEAIGFATLSFAPFAWTGSEVTFLQDLFVNAEWRGKGAGEKLLQAVYAEADAQGASQVYWMVDEDDARLQGFYEKHAIRTPYLRYMRSLWPW